MPVVSSKVIWSPEFFFELFGLPDFPLQAFIYLNTLAGSCDVKSILTNDAFLEAVSDLVELAGFIYDEENPAVLSLRPVDSEVFTKLSLHAIGSSILFHYKDNVIVIKLFVARRSAFLSTDEKIPPILHLCDECKH